MYENVIFNTVNACNRQLHLPVTGITSYGQQAPSFACYGIWVTGKSMRLLQLMHVTGTYIRLLLTYW